MENLLHNAGRKVWRYRIKSYKKKINKNYNKNKKKRIAEKWNLNLWERKFYSQNGEDGILLEIIKRVGAKSKYYVEFGTQSGKECNTRILRKKFGWSGLLMDGENENKKINLQSEFITAENVEELFKKYKVPKELDLLSIDVDGNDYWIWKAIKKYSPRIVIIEYNSKISPNKSLTIKYDPFHEWDGTDYMGASLLALKRLGEKKGYVLVCCDNTGSNAFFVRSDLLKNFIVRKYKDIYRKPKYGTIIRRGHPKSDKRMINPDKFL